MGYYGNQFDATFFDQTTLQTTLDMTKTTYRGNLNRTALSQNRSQIASRMHKRKYQQPRKRYYNDEEYYDDEQDPTDEEEGLTERYSEDDVSENEITPDSNTTRVKFAPDSNNAKRGQGAASRPRKYSRQDVKAKVINRVDRSTVLQRDSASYDIEDMDDESDESSSADDESGDQSSEGGTKLKRQPKCDANQT